MFGRPSLAGILLLLVTSSARADDTPEAKQQRAISAGRALFDKGVRQAAAKDIEGARISFAQSFASYPSIAALQNLAVAEVETGHCVEGLLHLRHYRRSKSADPNALEKDLPVFEARCNAQTGHLRVLVPEGVAVLVDGRRAIDLPDVIDVLPGPHVVEAQGPTIHESRPTSVAAGETLELRFGNPANLAATPPLDFAGTPVMMDNAQSPPPQTAPTAFPTATPAPMTTSSAWTANKTVAVVLGSTALASIAVGIGFGAGANSEKSSINQSPISPSGCSGVSSGACSALQHEKTVQRRDGEIADVTVGAGIGLAVAAAIVWFLPPARREHAQLWLSPSVSLSGAGVTGGYRF